MADDAAWTSMTTDGAGADVGAWDVDLLTGEAVVSARLLEMLGMAGSAQRLKLDDIHARYHPADRRRVADALAAALADPSRHSVSSRFRIARQDGTETWMEARDSIERDGVGRAIRTTGVMRAVPGKQRREPSSEQSLSRFEAALANTSVVVFQQDLELRYTWVHNPNLGFEAQSALGKTDAELTGLESSGPIDAIKRQVIATGRSARQEVTIGGRGAGGRYDLYVEPRRDETGVIVGITCAAIEVAGGRGGQEVLRNAGAPAKLQQAISDRDTLLDRIGSSGDAASGDRGLFTICIDVLRRKLAGFATLTREDGVLLGLLEKRRRFVPARQVLKLGTTSPNGSWLIGNGWVYAYKLLSNGERQVVGFYLPGDLIGAHGRGGDAAGCSYAAVTDCVICEFDRGMVTKLRRSETMLPAALQWSDAREEAILLQHLISVGRRSAIARVAHLLLELGARLTLVGLADAHGYKCPLSQELLADALGLTKIHVNRMLRTLREIGFLTFRDGYVSFGDMARLTELAEYDPGYLDLRAQPPAPRARVKA